MLKWLQKQLGPKEPSAEEMYRRRVEAALEDAFLSDDEWSELRAAADEYGLSEDRSRSIYLGAANSIIEQRLLNALSDGQLSPHEESDLEYLAKDLRIDLSFCPDTRAVMNRAKRTWQLTHDPLPIVPSPLGLQRGEVAHMWVTAEAFEDRQRTRAVSFAGPTVSIPIMKGVRYRMGRYNVGRETYQYQHSFGIGTMVVTNARLLFVGERSLTAKLTNILDIEGYSDGVKITRTTGKPHTFVYGEENRDLSTVLARAWVESRS